MLGYLLGVLQLVWFIGSVFVVFCYAFKRRYYNLELFSHTILLRPIRKLNTVFYCCGCIIWAHSAKPTKVLVFHVTLSAVV